MKRLTPTIPCAAACTAALVLSTSSLSSQSQAPTEAGHSFAIHAAGAAMRAEMPRVNSMLSAGDLDIASSRRDTMAQGRIHERLKQMYKGVPVFGSEVVRQMDGRTVISLSGRLYDNVTLDVTPQISSQAAEDAAVASAGSGANVHGEPTLGILPVEGESYKLAYRMQVRSDWDVRDIAVDALTGQIIYSRSMLEHTSTIGQGTGVLGDTKKMSVNSTSSTYEAVDGMRPAKTFTLDFRGSLSRLNAFLAGGLFFNSDIATDPDNVWTDAPVVDAHAYEGWVYDY